MKISKKLAILTMTAALAVTTLIGCGNKNDVAINNAKPEESVSSVDKEAAAKIDQMAEPQLGDTLATFHIKNYGDIVVRMFPEAAPKAVENFITHAKNGYYDGVTFHRVINDFMIQGGDPDGTGGGGESIWGAAFEDEFVENLMPVRGALCMANAGANTNGSQFFIVQAKDADPESVTAYLKQEKGITLTEEQKQMFVEHGGTPHLAYGHTVFGQVVEGMDVVDAIAATRTDASDRPTTDVVIESITVTEVGETDADVSGAAIDVVTGEGIEE